MSGCDGHAGSSEMNRGCASCLPWRSISAWAAFGIFGMCESIFCGDPCITGSRRSHPSRRPFNRRLVIIASRPVLVCLQTGEQTGDCADAIQAKPGHRGGHANRAHDRRRAPRRRQDVSAPGGPVHAVRGIDVSIARGETVALLGPNGAGKSTTIDMMLGLTAPGRRHRLGVRPAAARRGRRRGWSARCCRPAR